MITPFFAKREVSDCNFCCSLFNVCGFEVHFFLFRELRACTILLRIYTVVVITLMDRVSDTYYIWRQFDNRLGAAQDIYIEYIEGYTRPTPSAIVYFLTS